MVVQAHFPDSEYVKTEKRCGNYSFELGKLAASAPTGSSRSSWKLGKVPPKPAHALVRHPKRLLMDDITLHCWATSTRTLRRTMGEICRTSRGCSPTWTW